MDTLLLLAALLKTLRVLQDLMIALMDSVLPLAALLQMAITIILCRLPTMKNIVL
jgi:hypothetical protein